MSNERHTVESVRYQFDHAELFDLGQLLARQAAQVYDIERQKKDVLKSLGAALEHAQNLAAGTVLKINAGYEMRDVECLITLNRPKAGVKEIVRVDTGEIVREEAMTPEELQQSLPFEPEERKLN